LKNIIRPLCPVQRWTQQLVERRQQIFSVVATGLWYLWQGGGHHFANIVNADRSFFFQVLPVLIVAPHVVQHLRHIYER